LALIFLLHEYTEEEFKILNSHFAKSRWAKEIAPSGKNEPFTAGKLQGSVKKITLQKRNNIFAKA